MVLVKTCQSLSHSLVLPWGTYLTVKLLNLGKGMKLANLFFPASNAKDNNTLVRTGDYILHVHRFIIHHSVDESDTLLLKLLFLTNSCFKNTLRGPGVKSTDCSS